jgi:biotin transporter BioY
MLWYIVGYIVGFFLSVYLCGLFPRADIQEGGEVLFASCLWPLLFIALMIMGLVKTVGVMSKFIFSLGTKTRAKVNRSPIENKRSLI